ncbi:MAG: formylglycine-generating enzyme family protein, partial [Elainellaceae cyanobacterium]
LEEEVLEEPSTPEPEAELVPEPMERPSLAFPDTYRPIPVPDAPAIAHTLQLARSLRPLARQIAAGLATVIDEGATAERIAETGAWQPVLQPASELWLEVALVFDASLSMCLWQRLEKDLRRFLSHYGVFRDVRVWHVKHGANRLEFTSRGGISHKPRELLTGDRRRVVVMVSDCVAPAWHDGRMKNLMEIWSAALPTVICQVFPERLWARTALARSVVVELQAKQAGLPSDRLDPKARSYWDRGRVQAAVGAGIMRLPVVTLESDSLADLARVVAGRQGQVLGMVWDAEPAMISGAEPSAADAAELTEIVDDFLLLAPPTARHLATLLASAPVITLPIVRLIRQAMLPRANAVHVAEVLMSGLFQISGDTVPTVETAERVVYEVVDEAVRQRLRAGSLVVDAINVLESVSQYVAKGLGKSVSEFRALLRMPATGQSQQETEFLTAFATVTATILRGLGGEFEAMAERLLAPEPSDPVSGDEQEFPGFPPLEDFSFEVATVVEDVEEPPSFPNIPRLQRLYSHVATLQQVGRRWEIAYRLASGWHYVEQLSQRISIEMVAIPSGRFLMGSPEGEGDNRERPQHQVTVPPFFMGRYPITQAQWQSVAAMPKVEKDLETDPSRFKGDMCPVERVSWEDAMEFCARLSAHTGRSYGLPSEAEWEYACRAGTTTPFHFGETISPEVANYRGTSTYGDGPKGEYREETTPVAYFGVANTFGLCDMHGNVWEWCLDSWHGNYEGAPTDESAWDAGRARDTRVRRGGSWNFDPRNCRSAYRGISYPANRYDYFGFRVVCHVRGTP